MSRRLRAQRDGPAVTDRRVGIYQSDGCMPGGHSFVSVIDAIPTDGMNPLWQEVQVVFTSASGCQQYFSDDQILAAAAAGVVKLVPTGELYRCSVIGKP